MLTLRFLLWTVASALPLLSLASSASSDGPGTAKVTPRRFDAYQTAQKLLSSGLCPVHEAAAAAELLTEDADLTVFQGVSFDKKLHAIAFIYLATKEFLQKNSALLYRALLGCVYNIAAAFAANDLAAFQTLQAITGIGSSSNDELHFSPLLHFIESGRIGALVLLKRAGATFRHVRRVSDEQLLSETLLPKLEAYFSRRPDDFWTVFDFDDDFDGVDTAMTLVLSSSNLPLKIALKWFEMRHLAVYRPDSADGSYVVGDCGSLHLILKLMLSKDTLRPQRVQHVFEIFRVLHRLPENHSLVRTWRLLCRCRWDENFVPQAMDNDAALDEGGLLQEFLSAMLIKAGKLEEAYAHLFNDEDEDEDEVNYRDTLKATIAASAEFSALLARRDQGNEFELLPFLGADEAEGPRRDPGLVEGFFYPLRDESDRAWISCNRSLFLACHWHCPFDCLYRLRDDAELKEFPFFADEEELWAWLCRLSPERLTFWFREAMEYELPTWADGDFFRSLGVLLRVCHERRLWGSDSSDALAESRADTVSVRARHLVFMLRHGMLFVIRDLVRQPFHVKVDFADAVAVILPRKENWAYFTATVRDLLLAELGLSVGVSLQMGLGVGGLSQVELSADVPLQSQNYDTLSQSQNYDTSYGALASIHVRSPSEIAFLSQLTGTSPDSLASAIIGRALLRARSAGNSRLLVTVLGLRRHLTPESLLCVIRQVEALDWGHHNDDAFSRRMFAVLTGDADAATVGTKRTFSETFAEDA